MTDTVPKKPTFRVCGETNIAAGSDRVVHVQPVRREAPEHFLEALQYVLVVRFRCTLHFGLQDPHLGSEIFGSTHRDQHLVQGHNLESTRCFSALEVVPCQGVPLVYGQTLLERGLLFVAGDNSEVHHIAERAVVFMRPGNCLQETRPLTNVCDETGRHHGQPTAEVTIMSDYSAMDRSTLGPPEQGGPSDTCSYTHGFSMQ
mmetsp:Transcript_101235/g.315506  ORF Transcript_101235/g.315506 Transcript_101235/m.315506 type:complete len:202 (-) Transcript_101235:51-656(-)